ncbi:MAG: ABC transporter permease [Anaerolineales bacterium]|nr:MAG: ABC transporter permease [Anaerolineales bacterium]
MKRESVRMSSALRRVWAIVAKDSVDAIKSNTTISIILGTLMMVVTSQALPLLLSASGDLHLVVYDPADSRLVQALAESEGLHTVVVDSQEELAERLVTIGMKGMGLVVPVDFDDALVSGDGAEIQGYVVWARRGNASDLKAEVERHAERLLGQSISVDVEGNLVYPMSGSAGVLSMFQSTFVLQLLVVGAFVVSYLMFEEKEAKTIHVLLVSPATVSEVIAGKAATGVFYCGIAAVVGLVFGWAAVVNWGVVALVTAAIVLLAVGLGLLFGTLFDNPRQMSLWAAVPMLVLVVAMLGDELLVNASPVLAGIVRVLPTVAAVEGLQYAFLGDGSVLDALPQVAVVLAWTVPLYGIVVAKVRRLDR